MRCLNNISLLTGTCSTLSRCTVLLPYSSHQGQLSDLFFQSKRPPVIVCHAGQQGYAQSVWRRSLKHMNDSTGISGVSSSVPVIWSFSSTAARAAQGLSPLRFVQASPIALTVIEAITAPLFPKHSHEIPISSLSEPANPPVLSWGRGDGQSKGFPAFL